MPGQLEDRDLLDRVARARRAASRGDLHRRTQAQRPVPALPRRQRLRDPRQVRRLVPARSGDREGDRLHRRPAAGPLRRVRPPPLRLRSGSDGDPDRVRDLHGGRPTSFPGTTSSPDQSSRGSSSDRVGPRRQPVPRPDAAVPPPADAGRSNPTAGAFQRLRPPARPRRRRPVPRRPQLQDAAGLHRIPSRDLLLPGGRDRAWQPRTRAEPRAAPRAARRRARSARRTSPPARARIRSTRSAGSILRGRSRALRSRSPR